MKNINVLLISPLPPPVGGIATWTINIKDYMDNHPEGFKLTIVDSTQKGMSITSENFFERITKGYSNSIRIYLETKKCIKSETPSVIHLASTSSLALLRDVLIINLGRHKKIPVVMHWHLGRISLLAKSHNWEWKLLTFVIRNSFCSLVLDRKSHDALVAEGLTNVYNVPNPVGADFYIQARSALVTPFQKKTNSIVFIGHLVKEKGIYELIEACSQISVIKNLLLIGPFEKNTETKILQMADKRDKGKWITLAGTLDRENVMHALKFSSILVLPSYTEGFPNVVLEAMAMGCAVVATDVGAISDMLAITSCTPCGICVPVKDTARLKEAIHSLIDNPDKAAIMGKNGIDRVSQIYNLEKVVEQTKGIWEKAALVTSQN